jgi:hypothetical protein
MNFAKSWNPTSSGQPLLPSLVDLNGYPNTTLASNYSGNMPLVPNYNGQYALQYTGNGVVNLLDAAIVYSGGAAVNALTQGGGPAGTGYVQGNFKTIVSATSPSIVFKFGGLVASVSGGGGASNVQITTAIAINFTGVPTGTKVWFNQGCSANLVNGPNSDGSWTVTNVDSTHFTLNNSIALISPTVTGSGGVGTQTEVILARGGGSMQYDAGIAFSGFTALVLCTQSNLSDVNAGKIWAPDFVAQFLALKGTPGGIGRSGNFWTRFMDCCLSASPMVECDFSQRLTPSSQCWTSNSQYRQGYITPSTNAAITNGGSDNYTCADPSVSTLSGGVYLDNAIVQGIPSATNSGGNPTLAVGTGPAKPIFGFGNVWTIIPRITTLPTTPGTDVLQFTFQATWLNSNTPVVVNYTTVAGDTTIQNLSSNLVNFFNAQGTLTSAGIKFTNSNNAVGPCITAPTAQAGRMTLSYSGTATITPSTLVPSSISASGIKTFCYNYLMDGWLLISSGMNCAYPVESMIELCNRVGSNLWYNFNFTRAAYITSITQAIGDSVTGLTSGLQYGIEPFNETWNPGANPHGQLQTLGTAFGWNDGGNQSDSGYTGLKAIQYCAVASTAWTGKGRSASDIYMMQMSQVDGGAVGGGFDLYQLKGQKLVTSNTFYATYGGLNGGTATDHSTAPNRPVDFPTVFIGLAPYWNNKYLGGGSFTGAANVQGNGFAPNGTVAQNTLLLQASVDYANGLTSTAFASLVNQFNRVGTVGPNTGYDFVNMQTFFTQQEATAAQFDSGRSIKVGINHYEAGPSFGTGNNGNSGVNSVDNQASSIATADINALAGRITSPLGWTTTQLIPYTTSGTGNINEVATNILTMLQGWKYDLNANGTAANLNSYKNLIKTSYYQALLNTSGANRETHAGQYGYAGSNWGMLWSQYNTPGQKYTNYDALAEWNA